jgi:hypothetical protein
MFLQYSIGLKLVSNHYHFSFAGGCSKPKIISAQKVENLIVSWEGKEEEVLHKFGPKREDASWGDVSC